MLHHRAFVVRKHLVKQLLQFAIFDLGRSGRNYKGSLSECTNLESLLLQVGNQLGKEVGVGRGELAVDGEEQLLCGGRGLLAQ